MIIIHELGISVKQPLFEGFCMVLQYVVNTLLTSHVIDSRLFASHLANSRTIQVLMMCRARMERVSGKTG